MTNFKKDMVMFPLLFLGVFSGIVGIIYGITLKLFIWTTVFLSIILILYAWKLYIRFKDFKLKNFDTNKIHDRTRPIFKMAVFNTFYIISVIILVLITLDNVKYVSQAREVSHQFKNTDYVSHEISSCNRLNKKVKYSCTGTLEDNSNELFVYKYTKVSNEKYDLKIIDYNGNMVEE